MPSKNILKILALFDFLCCLCSLNRVFESELMNHSMASCKLINFSFYCFSTTSSWLVGIVSIEKLITIKKPLCKNIFAKKKYQIGVCIAIVVLNTFVFSPIFTLNDIYKDLNSTQIKNIYSDVCDILFTKSFYIIANLHFFNACILPFSIMLTSSIYLVGFILKSRKRTISTYSIQKKRIMKKDIHFALQILFLDILFLLFNTPLFIARNFKISIFFYIFRIFFCVRFFLNFFIYFTFNSIFRNELLLILGLKKTQ